MKKFSSAKKAVKRRRKLALALESGTFRVLDVEGPKRGAQGKVKMATLGVLAKGGAGQYTPGFQIAKSIRDALDPTKASGKVKTLTDMTEEEKAALEKLYGVPVKRSNPVNKWLIPVLLLGGFILLKKIK